MTSSPEMTPTRRVAAGFRMGADGATTAQSSAELVEELRSRLRLMSVIWAGVTATLAATGIAAHWEQIRVRPVEALFDPPMPGLLLVLVLFILRLGQLLAPGRTIDLRRLRMIEWVFVALSAGFFVINQTVSLSQGLAYEIRDNPMDLGAGFGAPWSVFIIAFGVLAPSGLRHSVTRTAVLALCAFVPEAIALPLTTGLTPQALTFLAIKVMSVGSMSALAIYGTYRVAELRRDAEEARQLGQYVLLRQLGAGGMGDVYLAEHQFLRRACAVKLIRPEQADDEATIARFEREVRAAGRLTHANTVQIYDYGRTDDGTFYYAMEYLPGLSLQEVVDGRGTLSPARTVRILRQLCGALSEAHAVGFVHRDIKPGNVMLCERGGVYDVTKLLDYGLVTAVQAMPEDASITQSGLLVGTPAFMSPEQCAGDVELTGASDIYSLGAVGFFLLTGREPFAGRSAMQMLAAHLYESAPRVTSLRADVTDSLADVIQRCLEKAPAQRFRDMAELERALAEVALADAWSDADARAWWEEHALRVGMAVV